MCRLFAEKLVKIMTNVYTDNNFVGRKAEAFIGRECILVYSCSAGVVPEGSAGGGGRKVYRPRDIW